MTVPMREPFGIATGAQMVADNVLLKLVLEDGTVGLGEAAPFPAVNGETQGQVLEALRGLDQAFAGRSILNLRPLATEARVTLRHTPSALAAFEMALLDAWCQLAHVPMWSYFGGSETALRTDITVVTGTVEHAVASAKRAHADGFDALKLKIGGSSLNHDVARIEAIAATCPQARLILDANASLTSDQALTLLRDLGALAQKVVLFEQPTAAGDVEALARVTREGGVPVAADESARSVADVVALAAAKAAQVINIKTMKTGVFEAWDMMVAARALGLQLMVGGMVETELSMTVSACLGAGFGGVHFFDLDTPLFLGTRPLQGGFVQTGPHIQLSGISAGHGVRYTADTQSYPR